MKQEELRSIAEEAAHVISELEWAVKRLPQVQAEKQELRDAACRAFAVLNAPEHDAEHARWLARSILRPPVKGDSPPTGLDKLEDASL